MGGEKEECLGPCNAPTKGKKIGRAKNQVEGEIKTKKNRGEQGEGVFPSLARKKKQGKKGRPPLFGLKVSQTIKKGNWE